MNLKHLVICLVFMLTLLNFSGCIQEESDPNQQPPEQPPTNSEHLTEEDWDYYQFHYNSGKDLFILFTEGFDIINKHISLFDPGNSSFLMEINGTNEKAFYDLHEIANTINTNATRYQAESLTYTVSSFFTNHSIIQKQLFNVYQNLSEVYDSVFIKVITSYNESNATNVYVDISSEMDLIFTVEQIITTLMNQQVDLIVNIPDEIWAEWDDKDWSFMG